MKRQKIDVIKRDILFKSPVEYKVKFLHGNPVYYITSTYQHNGLKELIALDTDTMEYFLLETSENSNTLYEKALKLTYEIMDEIRGILDPEERDKKIKEILKRQIKNLEGEK